MAGSNTFGGTIKLEGEKAYRSAISQINSELKVLASEMGKVSSAFSKNDTSVEHLTSRNKVLTSEIEKQKAKITTLKSAVEASAEKYGEHDKKTNNWKTSLNKAEAELNQMEKELKDNKDAMEKGEKATDDNSKSLKDFGDSADTAGQKTLKLGDLIKANLISDAIKNGLRSIGNLMLNIAKKGIEFLKKGIQTASDLVEVQNVVDVTFQQNAETINKWAKKAASAYGMSELSAKKYNGTMGAMLKSMGLTDDEVLNMSMDMVGLAGDFASFYNLDHEEAFNKIRAGISGETEPLKQLGINMSIANLEAFALSQGITKSYNAMTQSEKAILRYNYLMHVSADAQGDFARTSDSYANQVRIAQLNMENLSSAIGQKLLPVVNKAVKVFNEMINGTKDVSEGMDELADMVGNLASDFAEGLPKFLEFGSKIITKIVEGITKMLPKLAPSAVKIVETLVDGISKNLPKIITGAGEIVTTLAFAIIKNLPKLVEAGMKAMIALAKSLTESIPKLIPPMVDSVITMAETLLDNYPELLDAAWKLMQAILEAIIKAIPKIYEKAPELTEKIIDTVIEAAPTLLVSALKFLMTIVEAIPMICWEILKATPQIIWAFIKGLGKLPEMLWKILIKALYMFGDWGGMSEEEVEASMNEVVKTAYDTICSLPGKIWEIGKSIIEGLWNGIKSATGWLWEKISRWCDDFVRSFKSSFGIKSPSKVFKDQVGKNMALGVGEGFTEEMKTVSEQMEKAIPTNFDTDLNTAVNLATENSSLPIEINRRSVEELRLKNEAKDKKNEELLTEILNTARGINESLYGKFVSALVDGVSVSVNDREIARLVKRYA